MEQRLSKLESIVNEQISQKINNLIKSNQELKMKLDHNENKTLYPSKSSRNMLNISNISNTVGNKS